MNVEMDRLPDNETRVIIETAVSLEPSNFPIIAPLACSDDSISSNNTNHNDIPTHQRELITDHASTNDFSITRGIENVNAVEAPTTWTPLDTKNPTNSLVSLAADYASSDSDIEEIPQVFSDRVGSIGKPADIVPNNMQYRANESADGTDSEADSESDDSDSDDSTSSDSSDTSDSSSSSSNDDRGKNISRNNAIDCRRTRSEGKANKSEFANLPPIEKLDITVPAESCDLFGQVTGFVEEMVLVRPIAGKPTLNLDSILFLDKGQRVLGRIFDVFGQVAEPQYCIRFNSQEHIEESKIEPGTDVFYSPNTDYTSLVFLHELMKLKGIDISGEDDLDPPEFSDDEEERAYNQLQRQKQRQKPESYVKQNNLDAGELPHKRQCQDWPRNPWSSDASVPRSRQFRPKSASNWTPEKQLSFHNSQNFHGPPPSSFAGHQYGPPPNNSYNSHQFPFYPYNSSYESNNRFPTPNPGYYFGQPSEVGPSFPNFRPGTYAPNSYAPRTPWSSTPAPPPPPPPPPPALAAPPSNSPV